MTNPSERVAYRVTCTPGVKWGSPCIEGRGIRTASVGDLFRAEDGNIDAVAEWFGITPEDVLAAVLFEYRREGRPWYRRLMGA